MSEISFGAELIEQLKQKLDSTEQRLQFAELTIQSLQERLRQMLIKKYGASSETLSNAQLELLELEPGVSGDEVEAESAREALPPAPPEDSEAPDRKRDGRGQNHQGYLWQYGTPGGGVVFDFRLGRGREGPKQFLGQYNGILQTDGYAAYDHIGGPKLIRAVCWSHSRRKFVDAVKLNPQDVAGTRIVKRIDDLFAIDAEARAENMDHAARHASRLEKTPALLDDIRAQILTVQKTALPKSAAGKAANYTLALWDKLTRFLQYPELELSTNLAENSMRPIAIGRRNWIHLGSAQAGPKVAAIFSVVESCRRLKIPIRQYLAAVLPALNHRSIQRVAEITPRAWADGQHYAAS